LKQITFLFLLLIGFQAHGQMGWEVGGWGGIAYYFGDINSDFDLTHPGPSLGVGARYNFNERICLKFSANSSFVYAKDEYSTNSFQQNRNLSFQSLIFDGSAQLEFNFLNYVHGSKDEFFTPYLLGGFTVFNFNPKAEYQGELYELRPLGTEGQFQGDENYSTQLGIIAGGGLKFDLNYRWSMNVEVSARQLFTDYLDDVSGVYADKDDIAAIRGNMGDIAAALSDRSQELNLDAPIGEPGRQRGNSANNDRYATLTVGLLYYFGDIRCPSFPLSK